mmetsp:Transcript_26029/g.74527  ORF Transcript_26029/g.74527 Transcript_26029/m.74527 type:complete len:213 (-) Transcript_26029:573-1211(-)
MVGSRTSTASSALAGRWRTPGWSRGRHTLSALLASRVSTTRVRSVWLGSGRASRSLRIGCRRGRGRWRCRRGSAAASPPGTGPATSRPSATSRGAEASGSRSTIGRPGSASPAPRRAKWHGRRCRCGRLQQLHRSACRCRSGGRTFGKMPRWRSEIQMAIGSHATRRCRSSLRCWRRSAPRYRHRLPLPKRRASEGPSRQGRRRCALSRTVC